MRIQSTLLGLAISLGYRRPLAPNPDRSRYQNRHSARRINALMPLSGSGKKYLEIGVERGLTFEAIRAELKVCVDPSPLFRQNSLPRGAHLIVSTSADFFADGPSRGAFDFIFLDGLHTAEATYLDLVGALKLLSPDGTVLIDDVLPSDEASSLPSHRDSQIKKREQGIKHSRWYGDVWRVAWLLVTKYPEIEVKLIGSGGADHAQAIVKFRKDYSNVRFDLVEDLVFMQKLSFREVVTPDRLGALALSEEVVLARLRS